MTYLWLRNKLSGVTWQVAEGGDVHRRLSSDPMWETIPDPTAAPEAPPDVTVPKPKKKGAK